MSRHKLKSKEHDKKNRVKIGQTVTEKMAAQTRQVGKKTLLRKRPEKFLLASTYLKCTRIIVLGVPCDAGPLWHLMLAFVHFWCFFFRISSFSAALCIERFPGANDHVVCINFNASYLHEGVVWQTLQNIRFVIQLGPLTVVIYQLSCIHAKCN